MIRNLPKVFEYFELWSETTNYLIQCFGFAIHKLAKICETDGHGSSLKKTIYIPSSQKFFLIFQQNYNSNLMRMLDIHVEMSRDFRTNQPSS